MIKKILSDGTRVQAYPISIPQQFMFYMSAQYGASYPVNNIGMAYYIHGEIDEKKMEEAINEAVLRCDTMRLRFVRDEKYKILQYITEKSELVIEKADLSGLHLEEARAKLLSVSREEIPTYECEIHKIMLVKLEGGINCIFIRFHHFAMDAYSVKVFLNDIIELYLHKTEGAPYPKPMRPYIPELLKELSYMNSPRREEDRDFWFRTLSCTDEPVFTDYMLNNRLFEQRKQFPSRRFADIHSGSPEAGLFVHSMSAEDTDRILRVCEENGLSVSSFLSMGLRTALSVFNNNEKDVSFKMIVNRRGTLSEKKSGGIRINYFPLRSIIPDEMTYSEAVRKISDIQNEIYPRCSLSFPEILSERHKSMPADAKPDSTYDSIGFSYQPLTNGAKIPDVFQDSEWFSNGASMIPLYLTVKHRTSDGGFDLIFEYRKTPDPLRDLRIFCKKLEGAVISGAKNPHIKTGELLEKLKLTDEERNF